MRMKSVRLTITSVGVKISAVGPTNKRTVSLFAGTPVLRLLWLTTLVGLALLVCPGVAQFATLRPVTAPPQIGDRPIISDGIVWYLRHVPQHCRDPTVMQYPSGGMVLGKRALVKQDSPHVINGNIHIPSNSCLYIEPGSVLKFGPGFGIIVNGTLIARGSDEPGGRIVMTKAQGVDTGAPTGDWKYDARLSNGNTTQDGRLDLLYRGKWRAICTNYLNFTEQDVNVTCRHLGFLKGNFTYHSFSRNLTDYMLWERPGCLGTENSLFDCPGASRIKSGFLICDRQQVIGFECEGLRPGLAVDHWRGIEFFNSTSYRAQVRPGDNEYVQQSYSWLEYLDMYYPGLDIFHGRTKEPGIFYPKAAISASPLVPLINNVTIYYAAYDALNLTDITGPIHIANSTIHKSRGHGIFIKTAVGMTLINTTTVTDNWGDGVKFYMSNLTIYDFRQNFTYEQGFCFQASNPSQMYPTFQHLDAVSFTGNSIPGSSCTRQFATIEGKKVNIHFLIMERDPEASGTLIIRDYYSGGKLLGQFSVDNGSFPQSVRTESTIMWIRFDYNFPRSGCKTFQPCLRFLLRFGTSYGTEDEFSMIYSTVNNNVGYGINIQDMRSKVFVNTTEVSDNKFGAGIRVYQGAGEVIINNTRLEGNAQAGINITYSGGYQLINNTKLIANKGYGIITEYLLLNRSRFELMHKLEVVRGEFLFNELIGLRVGNYCRGGLVLVNESNFMYNWDEAIEYLSCNISTKSFPPVNFSVAFSHFSSNYRHAIFMRPLLNTVGIITNCSFSNHSTGALRIDNEYDLLISKWYREFPVDYNIFANKFENNYGRYAVYLRLTDSSPKQVMYFKFNKLVNNQIQESFPYINPRNRANAVVILSSRNILFKRNILQNRATSVREVATHLVDPSVTIDATENYWDIEIVKSSEFEEVHKTIFDQDDRYNLARVKYYPALKTDQVYENQLTTDVPEYRWQFQRGNRIGGLLDRDDFVGLQRQTYIVDRDIYIFPGRTFRLQPRATLLFQTAVGMVVHGCLIADGQTSDSSVRFNLWENPDILPLENRTASVRLSNGSDLYEGRLEVLIDDEWGTVCSDGWTEREASLACLQLGLTYNPDQGVAKVRVVAPSDMPVLMSWISCDDVDADLTKCRAVQPPEILCGHDRDVYLRCQEPTWAGINLPATARLAQNCETQLREAKIERAGMLDAEALSFTPALRIDYNFYQITSVTITNCLSDGVHVMFVHPFETARLERMQIHNNLGNGIVTRYPRQDVRHCNITGNAKAGFLYDTFFTEYDALSVRSMVHETRRSFITQTPTLNLDRGQMTFLLCPPGADDNEQQVYYTEISTLYSAYRIVLQVLDYFPLPEKEQVIIYDTSRQNVGSPTNKKWRIPDDLIDFPVTSSGTKMTIELTVRGLRSGRIAFAVICQEMSSARPVLTTFVFNSTFAGNYQGLKTKHYNSPTNRRLEVFHRFAFETVKFEEVWVRDSIAEAMHVPSVTKFNEDFIPTYEDMTTPERVATIQYNITLSSFINNAKGILAEHNHVDFANNVWKWNINNTVMDNSKSGGLEIEVPRVNSAAERMSHAVTLIESRFRNNQDFICAIRGYYAEVKVNNNLFQNNRSPTGLGLLTITGMEKTLSIVSNRFINNVGRHMVDIVIKSHSEYSQSILGTMRLNDIQNNRYDGLSLPGYGSGPTTFAVSFVGVQQMVMNRNLLSNPDLGYELVAGITALSLINPINVTQNFWGRTDYAGIMDRIFDFDDWNNYAIASFFPYLTRAEFDSDLSTGQEVKPPFDIERLGGRVLDNQILPYRTTPYIVERDLTVMPDATLIISAGTQLHFRPNVGILVLGRLIARGVQYNRIVMRPVPSGGVDPLITSGRKKRAVSSSTTLRLRGDGTLFKDSGFLEMYNSSTKTWNMVCDNQFNEKSAMVACRQLGKETVNVRVRFTHLYDHYIYGQPQYFLKEFWYESYFCGGDETDLRQCTRRYNYNMQDCIRASNYTFVVCGERNLQTSLEYWGNVRFAPQSYEEQPLEADIGRKESVLEYVDIVGAGMLHGEKVGAVQTTYITPTMSNLNITRCAENGLDLIAPRRIMELERINVTNNLGIGINFLVLNGESSTRDSSFLMLGESTIPYHVYGLVEICRMEKIISLSTRMILYYKYGPTNRDCVKVIKSGTPRSQIGLRFLQVNMFEEYFSLNSVEIFDGNSIDPRYLMAEVTANSSGEATSRLYLSTFDTLTVHLHASVSQRTYGFIAEVVQVPLTGLTYPDSNYLHKVTRSIFNSNQEGALRYKNVGEVNPSFYVDQCQLENNGVGILNLTSPPTIDISLQGTLIFRFSSNFVSQNKGGMYLYCHTRTIATALSGNITNNVFAFGKHGEALNITGHYYQRLFIFQNLIYNYSTGDWRDLVHIRDVKVNFTWNYCDNNTANNILAAFNSDNQQARQEYTKSGFFRNNATALIEATIKVGHGRPLFENNYIVNEQNDFELETYPMIDSTDLPIDTRNNWWGSEMRSFISGKIWDSFDDPKLVSAEFWQPKLDNRSVVEGKCLPGWKLDSDRCYRFMGGALNYFQARDFCNQIGAYLAEARGREGFFNYLLRLMRNNNDGADRVWVMSEVGTSRCSALEYSYIVYEEDCWNLMYPFICELDPYISPPVGLADSVRAMAIGIGAGIGGVIMLLALILGVLWCVKSQRREKERFERTESIRSSMHLSKSNLTLTDIRSQGRSRQRLQDLDEFSQTSSKDTKASRVTENLNGSMGSLNHLTNRTTRAAQPPFSASRAGLADRERRFERGGGRNQYSHNEDRELEQERNYRRGKRYQDDAAESERETQGQEESDSEFDKQEFDSTEGEEEEEPSVEEEEEVEEAQEDDEGRTAYQNENYGSRIPQAGLGRAGSREDVYENEEYAARGTRSKPLSSFSQPEDDKTTPEVYSFPRGRNNLPPPPQTAPKPQVGPKPLRSGPTMPAQAASNLWQSPASSQGSGNSRPYPLPRKDAASSLGSDQTSDRGSVPYGSDVDRLQRYQNHAAKPLPGKIALGGGSQEFLPSSLHQSFQDDDSEYASHRPPVKHFGHLPNLPRYSPPLPMEGPPSYEETEFPDHQPQTMKYLPPSVYRPPSSSAYDSSQDTANVEYLPRRQPDTADRGHFGGSRGNLSSSREQLSYSREQLNCSLGQLNRSQDNLNRQKPANILYLGSHGSGDAASGSSHIETEI